MYLGIIWCICLSYITMCILLTVLSNRAPRSMGLLFSHSWIKVMRYEAQHLSANAGFGCSLFGSSSFYSKREKTETRCVWIQQEIREEIGSHIGTCISWTYVQERLELVTHFSFDRSHFSSSVSIRHAYDHWDSGLVKMYTLNQVSVTF